MGPTVIASAAIAAGAGVTARELGFNENAWGVIVGLATFLACLAHERLPRRQGNPAGLRASGTGLILARPAPPPTPRELPPAATRTDRPEEREASEG